MIKKTCFVTMALGLATVEVTAAPTLKLHMFDQEQVSQPTKLKLHVFKAGTTQAEHQTTKQAQVHEKQSPISYRKADVYVRTGLQSDEHRWTISGLNGYPNILSELNWENLRVAKVDAGAILYFSDNWQIGIDVGFGKIYDGVVQDSDYYGNNRTFEFSRSNNSADNGDVYDFSISIGKTWQINSYNLWVTPSVGYSYRAQNLKMTDGNQTVSNSGFTMPLGRFPGLDSEYNSTWQGPWLGFDTDLGITDKLTLSFGSEFHYSFYDAVGTWNLRGDLAQPKSFTNEAEGVGIVLKLGANYQIAKQMGISLSLERESWDADRNGEKTTYGSNGVVLTGQPFNDAERETFLASLGFNYTFE